MGCQSLTYRKSNFLKVVHRKNDETASENVLSSYRYGYQGEFAETDPETGKPAFQLRIYDPRINRWLTTDPKGQYHSPYMAMGNNWMNGTDPDGGCWDSEGNPCPDGGLGDTTVDGMGSTWSFGENGWDTNAYDAYTIYAPNSSRRQAMIDDFSATYSFAQDLRSMGMEANITNNRREAMNSNINLLVGLALPSGKLATKGTSLSDDVGKTFWGGRYEKVVFQEATTLSRYFDDVNSFAKGRYMTNSIGNKFIDRIGLALRPSWNKMTSVADWVIPAGTTVYKGRAGMQFPFIGGRTQYFIPDLHGITKFIK